MLLETVTSTIESSNDKAILKKVISNKKKIYFEEKIVENRNNPKELWRTLISLCMLSKGGMESKILKENGVVSFNSNDNAKFFCRFRFFSNSADSLLQKLLRPKNKSGIKTTEEYYKHIWYECEDIVLCNVDIAVDNTFFNWYSLHARLISYYETWSYKKKKHKLRCCQDFWNRSHLCQIS